MTDYVITEEKLEETLNQALTGMIISDLTYRTILTKEEAVNHLIEHLDDVIDIKYKKAL